MAAEIPQGPGGGAEPEAERRNLQQRFEGPQQLPLPAAGQTLHTQGEVTWDKASLCIFIHLSFYKSACLNHILKRCDFLLVVEQFEFMGCHVVAAAAVSVSSNEIN